MIDNLSTEEYSFFLAYGVTPLNEPTQRSKNDFHSVLCSTQLWDADETSDSNDERIMPQGIEDVCSIEGEDSVGCVLFDDACTHT